MPRPPTRPYIDRLSRRQIFPMLAAGVGIGAALKGDAQLADGLDKLEGGLAVLVADGVAQHLAEQAHLVDQGLVTVLVFGRARRGWRRMVARQHRSKTPQAHPIQGSCQTQLWLAPPWRRRLKR